MDSVNALKTAPTFPDNSMGSTATLEEMRTGYTRQRDKLKKATQDFEAVFLTQILKQAHKTMQGEGSLFGKSSQSQFYAEMRDEMMAQNLSKTGQFGLGRMLFQKLEQTLPPNPDQMIKDALKILR